MLLALFSVSCSNTTLAAGKADDREGAPEVAPVYIGGVRYEAVQDGLSRGLKQDGGYLQVVDPATNQLLWRILVYNTPYNANMERDLQELYIRQLNPSADCNELIVEDENGGRYRVNLIERRVVES
ncbi:MAG: hypothetical protein L3J28_02500 [Candidatus Polarisedimenticolaceae bacterium]|nr:hypothetical protein [Candidatus Polarisedimenticolaceae bacterium]